MSDPLYNLLSSHLPRTESKDASNISKSTDQSAKYLSRLLSLRLTDLTTTEPQSLAQAGHSNNVNLQALSSRSHRTTTTSASHLSTLESSLPSLTYSLRQVRDSVPSLDKSAVSFASTYARSRDVENQTLQARRDAMLLARQSDKLTDIFELPSLLSTAIASAGSGAAGGANYSQALDLFAHIRRLSIVYPDSALVASVQAEAEVAMKSMTTNLLSSLRSQNIRLAATIRTIGWLRRVVPELSNQPVAASTDKSSINSTVPNLTQQIPSETSQSEASFGALFLVSRLHTFLTMTEALAPLMELADQETEQRISSPLSTTITKTVPPSTPAPATQANRRSSVSTPFRGTQTERYLKRYIEIFREQSFSTISMYRNIFPQSEPQSQQDQGTTKDLDPLALPSALQQFPLHLVEIFIEVLQTYLPNVTDPAARESLLMQVLYAANSLGRLGADFSMMISLLGDGDGMGVPGVDGGATTTSDRDQVIHEYGEEETAETAVGSEKPEPEPEPEWARIMKKHRVQAAKLDALAAVGQKEATRRVSDVAVR